MFDTICTLPLTSDLFAQAIHPTAPILSVGLSAGHVQTYKLPAAASNTSKSSPSEDDDDEDSEGISILASESGLGEIETAWRTRRHKGSCRCVAFSCNGDLLYSAGTDGLVKAAKVETGVVTDKIAIPGADGSDVDFPTVIQVLTPQTFLLATDSSALHLYDIRTDTSRLTAKPPQTHRPHDDFISSLIPLPPSEASTSGYSKQFITTGGTTLAITDIRRGVLVRSEDQEDELLTSAFVSGLRPSKGNPGGEKVLVGGAGGVITLWEKGAWDDQDERIVVDRNGESLESLSLLPDGFGGTGGRHVATGMGDGLVKIVRLGVNKIVGEVRHDEMEGVVGLGFDYAGRMVSGGGTHVKVWHEAPGDIDDDEQPAGANGFGKRAFGSDSENEDSDEENSEEERPETRKRKKRKRGKGKDRSGGQQILAIQGLD